MTSSSEVPGFYKKNPSERLEYVKKFANLSDEETAAIGGYGALGEETANRMIENVSAKSFENQEGYPYREL